MPNTTLVSPDTTRLNAPASSRLVRVRPATELDPKSRRTRVMLTNAFDRAQAIDTEVVYDDFIKVAGKSPYTFAAVAQEFELFRQVDTISEYERFIVFSKPMKSASSRRKIGLSRFRWFASI